MATTAVNAVAQIYVDGLDGFLQMARKTLNDPTFGQDLEALAARNTISELPESLETEVLHFARTVLKHRQEGLITEPGSIFRLQTQVAS